MNSAEYIDAEAAVVRAPGGGFTIEPVRVRRPREDEVLVRVSSCGLCHADLIARDQGFPVPLPAVLGHEGAGIVAEVGPEVRDLAVGDHVVLSFGSCGACRWCGSGETAYCEEFLARNFACTEQIAEPAVLDRHGEAVHSQFFSQSSLATFALARRRNTVRVPADAPLDFLGPLGCGIQTGAGAIMNSLKVPAGSSVVIFGMGAVGLSALLAARCVAANTVIAVDIVASRLELARGLGASLTLDSRDPSLLETIREATRGGADFAVEASGHPDALRHAIASVGTRGGVAVLGSPPPGTRADFDVHDLLQSGKTIRGVVEGDSLPESFIPQLVALWREGRLPFEKMMKFYDFKDINRAVADSERGTTPKAVVRMGS